MSIGNHTYDTYFFLYQDTVCYNWRFLTSPPDGGFVRNDNFNWFNLMGKHWRFAERIANTSPYTTKGAVIPSVSEESHDQLS
jgi:hypothetical protein